MQENIGNSDLKQLKKKELFDITRKLSCKKIVFRKFISNRRENTKAYMKKPVFLGLSILSNMKLAMQEIWFDYIKPKYGNDTLFSLNNSLNENRTCFRRY